VTDTTNHCLWRGDASRGKRPVVFVTGEPGVGKTALVDLFVQRVGLRPDVRTARGQCLEMFGGQEAYYPLLEAVDQLVRQSEDEQLVQMLRKRAPTWLLQFPSLVKLTNATRCSVKQSGPRASGWYARSVRCSRRLRATGS